MEILANHAHIFQKEVREDGTVNALEKFLDECGIDKAVCFAMAMKRKPLFIVSSEGKKSKVLKNANERAMAEALLVYLTCSEYKMLDHHKKIAFKNRFDLEAFGEGHKRELKVTTSREKVKQMRETSEI